MLRFGRRPRLNWSGSATFCFRCGFNDEPRALQKLIEGNDLRIRQVPPETLESVSLVQNVELASLPDYQDPLRLKREYLLLFEKVTILVRARTLNLPFAAVRLKLRHPTRQVDSQLPRTSRATFP